MFDCVSEDSNGQAAWGIRGDGFQRASFMDLYDVHEITYHTCRCRSGGTRSHSPPPPPPPPPFFGLGGGGGINVKMAR